MVELKYLLVYERKEILQARIDVRSNKRGVIAQNDREGVTKALEDLVLEDKKSYWNNYIHSAYLQAPDGFKFPLRY